MRIHSLLALYVAHTHAHTHTHRLQLKAQKDCSCNKVIHAAKGL